MEVQGLRDMFAAPNDAAWFKLLLSLSLSGSRADQKTKEDLGRQTAAPGSMIDSLTKVTASSLLAYAKNERSDLGGPSAVEGVGTRGARGVATQTWPESSCCRRKLAWLEPSGPNKKCREPWGYEAGPL